MVADVFRAGVAYGDGGVGVRLLLEQHGGHGLADDIAAADDDHMRALGLHAAAREHLNTAVRGTGQEALLTDQHFADIDGMETIDIFVGVDRQQGGVLIHVLGQRELKQDAVDLGVVVHAVNQRHERFLGGVDREAVVIRVDAGLCAGLLLGADVGA